jgi:hypothetical protein
MVPRRWREAVTPPDYLRVFLADVLRVDDPLWRSFTPWPDPSTHPRRLAALREKAQS